MEWILTKDELPPDDLRVFLCDSLGMINIGTRDEYGYYDDYCSQLHNIALWAYIEIPHVSPKNGIITNDKWIDNLIKQGQLKIKIKE